MVHAPPSPVGDADPQLLRFHTISEVIGLTTGEVSTTNQAYLLGGRWYGGADGRERRVPRVRTCHEKTPRGAQKRTRRKARCVQAPPQEEISPASALIEIE